MTGMASGMSNGQKSYCLRRTERDGVVFVAGIHDLCDAFASRSSLWGPLRYSALPGISKVISLRIRGKWNWRTVDVE